MAALIYILVYFGETREKIGQDGPNAWCLRVATLNRYIGDRIVVFLLAVQPKRKEK
jgi:hypothetical protein